MWNLFKVDNEDTRTTPSTSFWSFIIYFEQISHCSAVSIVDFEQEKAGWTEWLLWHTSSADIASARQSPSVTPKHATLYASLENKQAHRTTCSKFSPKYFSILSQKIKSTIVDKLALRFRKILIDHKSASYMKPPKK